MKNSGFLGSVRMKALGVLATAVLLAALPSAATAQEGQFILHPAYINGTVTIPDGFGGNHSIVRIYVSANGYDPATQQSYYASTSPNGTNQFNLVVEGGGWPYYIQIAAGYGAYPYNQVQWYKTVTVSPGQTVQLDLRTDAFIVGTVSVAGETVRYMEINASVPNISSNHPQYGFQSRAYFTNGQYRLPVLSGSGTYRTHAGQVRLTDYDDVMNLGYKTKIVSLGEEALVDFSTVPGYIEGSITVLGASIYQGTVGVYWSDPATGQSYSASTKTPYNSGTFRFPAVPMPRSQVYGSFQYDYGRASQQLIQKTADVVAGETTIVNWTVDLNAGISGDIAVTGINLDYIQIYGYGPNGASRSASIYTPAATYDWDAMLPGNWGITVYVYDYYYDAIFGIQDWDYYYFPKANVEVEPGGQSTVNFTINPGFIGGSILAGNSASIPDLYYTRISAYPPSYFVYPYSEEYAYTYQYDLKLQDDHYINDYRLFVSPGQWRLYSIEASWRHRNEELGYWNESSINLYERIPGTPYTYNLPLLTVNSGETVQFNLGYQTAKITARLRVATGAPLSSPRVSGSYLRNPEGVVDKSCSISGNTNAGNVQEGRVEMYAVPGTYKLSANATVGGTSTTFGQPFLVTVQAGDVVVTDPDAPAVDISAPPGNFETYDSCIEVTGTVTDENGITTFTINGVPVGIGPDGSFGTIICDLVLGPNTITVNACDEYGNCVTIDRTVFRMNHAPEVLIGGPYNTIEGVPLVFSAANSYDLDNDPLQFRWDFNNDGVWDTEYSSNPEASYMWPDDYHGSVVVQVTDGHDEVMASTIVTVADANPVIAAVTGPTGTVRVGERVNLSASFTDQGILDTHTASIDWGDGAATRWPVTESGGNGTVDGSHVYTTPGVFHVTVVITDDEGGYDTEMFIVTLNNPPSAAIGGPYIGTEGSAITLSAAGSSDADGDPLQYRWDFNGDGTWDTDYSSSPVIDHIWADDYSGTVAVEVYDGHAASTASTSVSVADMPPAIISITGPTQTIRVGATADLSASFTDPGTQDTYVATIDWGDGAVEGAPVTPAEGGGTVEASHAFTAPGDYHVTLTITDDDGASDTKEFIITVNNPPVAVIGGPYSGAEGSAIAFTAAGSSDLDGDPLQYRWDFDNDGIWDTPYSASAEASHTWTDDYSGTVTVEVFDGYAATTASTTVTVAGVEPTIGTITGPTDKILVGALANLSASFTDPGTMDTHTVAFNWGDGTTTPGMVTESEGSGTAEGSYAFTAPGEYHVAVTVTDDDGKSATKEYVVTVDAPPVAAIAPTTSGVEGSAVTFSAAGSSDPDGDPLQYRWDFDNDGSWDTGYSSSAVAAHTWADDYSGNVVVEVYDGYATTTASTALTVANVKPTITSISGPTGPLPLGSSVSMLGNFTDPGTVDTHTAIFAWGDGTSSNGTIDESGGSGTAAGSHVYTTPGVYRVTLTVTDDEGGSDTEEYLFAVIFDPTGSFVTGGGAIDSPLGAYTLNPALTGKASFGFVSKYQKGATVPTGNTQFKFQAGDLSFHSIAYEWLVISGARAQYKGTGMINGAGVYGFMLTAIDGQVNGGGGVDKFRIKIWDIGTGIIVYDNQMGTPDDGAVVTALTQGSITIHK